MKCFKHPENDGVGICKSCYKAVCSGCAIEIPHGLACSPVCEKDAKEIIEMNERGKKIYGIGDYPSNKLASGVIVWLLLTAVMWAVAALNYYNSSRLDYGSLAMALIFSIITFVVYRGSKRTGLNC